MRAAQEIRILSLRCANLCSRRIIVPSQKSMSRGSYTRSTRSRLSAHVDNKYCQNARISFLIPSAIDPHEKAFDFQQKRDREKRERLHTLHDAIMSRLQSFLFFILLSFS